MKFGKYAVVEPVTYNFAKEPDWYWKFKPPTARDELNMQRFLWQRRNVVRPDGSRESLPATEMDVVFHQLGLTFGGTNIPQYKLVDDEWVETDKPILQKDADVEEVKSVLGEMPTDLVKELWEALGEHVPNWGPVQDDPKDESLE
jgi:hypothetical protein